MGLTIFFIRNFKSLFILFNIGTVYIELQFDNVFPNNSY